MDIALHDLAGKLMKQPWYNIWGYDPKLATVTTFTIGIDRPDVVRQKTREAAEFKVLKIKLGRDTDKAMVEAIRSLTDKPLSGDANQGWTDRQQALDMIGWLKERGFLYVEQPLPKERVDDLAWLTERSPLPVIGDEGVQRLPDVRKALGVYSGINIKLMKSTGMRDLSHARTVIEEWRNDYNLQRPHTSLKGLTPYEFAGLAENCNVEYSNYGVHNNWG